MNYSTRELTKSLQKIARTRRESRPSQEDAFNAIRSRNFSVSEIVIPESVDSFLKERRAQREEARKLNEGRY